MKEIELFINDDGEWIDRISLVEEPAIETDFMAFAKEHMMFSTDDDKQILTGPVMIPDKRMYRNYNGGCMVYFSAATIREAAYRWIKENKSHCFNIDHNTDIHSVSVIESWIVEDPMQDKSAFLGFTDIPTGTWFISCKIDDPELWAMIKSGEFNGFSVEGLFRFYEPEEFSIIREAEEYLESVEKN